MKESEERIDCHVHVTENGKWFNTSYNSSVDFLIAELDEAEIERAIVLPIFGITSNLFVRKISNQFKDRLIGFGSISVRSWQRDLAQIMDLNLSGIKFHPRIQHETIQQWDQAGLLDAIEELKLPLLICGWQQTNSESATMDKIQPILLDDIAKRHRNLKVIIAHLGGHNFYDAFFCARSNPNVYLDCSYFFNFFRGTSLETDALTLFHKLDQKIIFGSDFPEVSIPEYVNYFKERSDMYEIDLRMLFGNINNLINKA